MSSNGNLLKMGGVALGSAILVGGGIFLGLHFAKGDSDTTTQSGTAPVTQAAETQPEFVVIPAEPETPQTQVTVLQNAAEMTTTTVYMPVPVNTAAAAQQTKQPVIQQAKIKTTYDPMAEDDYYYQFSFDIKGEYDYWIAAISVTDEGSTYQITRDSREDIPTMPFSYSNGTAFSSIRASIVPYYNNGTVGAAYTVSCNSSDLPKQQQTPTLQYDSEGVAYPSSYSGYSAYSSPKSGYCNTTSCYIRNSADTNGAKTEQRSLYKLDPVMIYGEVNGFYYISTDSGSGYDYYGYVQKSHLKIGNPPADPNRNYNATSGYVSSASANLRSSPSKENNNNVICSLNKGTTFTVLSFDGYWYYISCDKGTGYLSYKMVTVK